MTTEELFAARAQVTTDVSALARQIATRVEEAADLFQDGRPTAIENLYIVNAFFASQNPGPEVPSE
jgi:hypothetical protein